MKKLTALILAVLLALTLTVSVFAYEDNELVLAYSNSADWKYYASDPVAITGDGEYTLKIEGLDYAMEQINVIFVKDAKVHHEEATVSAFPKGIEILTKSVKINGEECPLTDGYPTTHNGDIIDTCYYNVWATSYIDTAGIFDVQSIEVTIEVKFPEVTEEPAPEKPAEEAPATEPEITEEDEPAETGLALSLIPAAIALAVVVLKRR